MKKATVMVVDDDERHLRLIEAMLVSHGYEVIQLKDGTGLADIARSRKPDLILLDVMMPQVDGYTALGQLKNDPATRAIPVVMVTALGLELNKTLAERLGAAGYITKPVELKALVSTVESFLVK